LDFDSLASLNSYLEKKISSVLQKEVLKVVQDEMIESIKENVYDRYHPTQYVRQKDKGGLIDRKNIKGYLINGRTLMVKNERKDGDKDVVAIVSSGKGYTWTRSEIYQNPFPREFMKPTVYRLKNSDILINAMLRGLRDRFKLNVVRGS
jgi:hypothetical protein